MSLIQFSFVLAETLQQEQEEVDKWVAMFDPTGSKSIAYPDFLRLFRDQPVQPEA